MSSNVYSAPPGNTPPPTHGSGPNPVPPGPTVFPPPGVQAEARRDPAASARGTQSDTDPDKPNPAAEAVHRIKNDLFELKEYAGHYVGAKVDGVKRTVRNIGLYAALGIVGAIAGGAIVATAAGLLVVGIADLLTRLFGGREWLGEIVTALLVLGAIGGAAWYMMNKLTGTWRSQTIKKYEQRKQSQREQFGHDLTRRAAQAGTPGSPGPQKRS